MSYDILLVVEQTEHVEQIFAALNNVHPNINLTCESERENKVPFFDVMIHMQTAKLSFGWYHKPNWAGQYLHYHSFVPLGWKKSLLNGLKSRLLTICSVEHIEEAVHEVYRVLGNNGYPNIFIQNHFMEY